MADSYTTDGTDRMTIIGRRSGGAGMTIGMIVIIALIAAVAFFLFAKDNREQRQTDAVVGAAQSVGDAARDAAAKIGEAADRITPKN